MAQGVEKWNLDNLEEQLKDCAFSQGTFKVPDDAKKLFQSFMNIPPK